jgi:cyclin-dependent kinase-like
LKLPNVPNPETLEKKYTGKLANKALNLMQGMLKMDPKERLSAIECLTHSYFDDLRLNDSDFLKIINDEN